MSRSSRLSLAAFCIALAPTLPSRPCHAGGGPLVLMGVTGSDTVVDAGGPAAPDAPVPAPATTTRPVTTPETPPATPPARPRAPANQVAAVPARPVAAPAPATSRRPRIQLETPGTPPPAPAPVAKPAAPASWLDRVKGLVVSVMKWLPELLTDVTKWWGRIFGA